MLIEITHFNQLSANTTVSIKCEIVRFSSSQSVLALLECCKISSPSGKRIILVLNIFL